MKYSLKRGYSPVHLASYYGQISVIEYLVRNQSVNVNEKATGNGRGLTPLHSAVEGCFRKKHNPRFKETIDMLLKLGADLNIKDDRTSTEYRQGKTAKQFAQTKLLKAIQDFNDDIPEYFDYEYFEDKFNNCRACVEKKEEEGLKYWSQIAEENFLECFNECSDTPCYYNFP